jgi:hypothetical protein
MRRLTMVSIVAAAAALAGGAQAQRPDTRAMTCAQVNQLVQQYGQVVMTTGQHTYQRFVANWGYCDRWQETWPEYAPTRDTPRCPVHYVCREPFFDHSGLFD